MWACFKYGDGDVESPKSCVLIKVGHRQCEKKSVKFIISCFIMMGNFGKRLHREMLFNMSSNVAQTQLNHEKSDGVPSTVPRIVTVIIVTSLHSVPIYSVLERTVLCPLRLFYFCFIRTDPYCSWSALSQSALLRMWLLVVET
jgi:hypothetical protein